MSSAATALQSQQLVAVILAYQQGIHADMRPLLSTMAPFNHVTGSSALRWVDGALVKESFASFDAAVTSWYQEWGVARISKLFACLPQMEPTVIAHALWSGNLSVLTLLPVEMLRKVTSRVVALAAFHSDKSVLQYLHDVVGLDVSTPGAMTNAAQCGHLDVIRCLHELNNDTNVREAAVSAAQSGHLEAVEFFHIHCPSCSIDDVFRVAIEHQDLVVAQFVLDVVGKDNLHWSSGMQAVLISGGVAILEWWHQRGFAFSTDAMDLAALYGHLDLVQWLHANRSEGCTELAMHYAATTGHLNVVEWLAFNRHEGCTTTTLEETTRRLHWEVVRFLLTHGIDTGGARAALSIALENTGTPADVVAFLESTATESHCRKRKQCCT